jgi:hypothetical protein
MTKEATGSSFQKGGSTLTYQFDDVRASALESASVDCIVDKGVLDALACSLSSASSSSSSSSAETREEHRALGEYHRVLTAKGVLVLVTGRPRSVALAPFKEATWGVLAEVNFRHGLAAEAKATCPVQEKKKGTLPRDLGENLCRLFVFSCRK